MNLCQVSCSTKKQSKGHSNIFQETYGLRNTSKLMHVPDTLYLCKSKGTSNTYLVKVKKVRYTMQTLKFGINEHARLLKLIVLL